MKPETVVKIFEYITGIPFEIMIENVVKASVLDSMSARKKRHLKRYLRIYGRHAPNTASTGCAVRAAKLAVSRPDPFSVFGAGSPAHR